MQYDSLTPPNFWDRSGFLVSEYHQKILVTKHLQHVSRVEILPMSSKDIIILLSCKNSGNFSSVFFRGPAASLK
jgi:hypothetical protein